MFFDSFHPPPPLAAAAYRFAMDHPESFHSTPLSLTSATSSCPSDVSRLSFPLLQTCQRIQATIVDPLQVILHRSSCCRLAKAYALGVLHVQEQIHKALTNCPAPFSSENLVPSLTALHHTMMEGEKFITDCKTGVHWVKKALTLALSTEAVDVHFQDLVWSISVVNASVGRNLGTTDDEHLQENAKGRFDEIKCLLNDAKSKRDEDLNADLALVLRALEDLKATMGSDEVSSNDNRFANFIFQKLSNRPLERVSTEKLPRNLWVDRQEFQILGSLGCGGYATVYKVGWLGENFAMKEFSYVGSASSCGNEVFEKEAAIQARLQHPNVMQLICCTETPDGYNCGLVMELMQQDLRSLIDKRVRNGIVPPFSLPIAVDIMLQIAKGMEYLHSLHVMHRDLKSFNVLVSPQDPSSLGGDGRVRAKISDFGMSKAKYTSSKYSTMHAGTTYWRAPEVFAVSKVEEEMESKSNAKYTKKADVYSFAMVCYEILTGKLPFKDTVPSKLHKKLVDGVRPRLPSSCPQMLASYIAKCWHGDASKRPSFAEISRTLGYLKGVLLTFADPMLSLNRSDPVVEKLMELMDSDTNERSCYKVRETNEEMEENEGEEDNLDIEPLADDQQKGRREKIRGKRTTLHFLKELVTCMMVCKHRGIKEPTMSSPKLQRQELRKLAISSPKSQLQGLCEPDFKMQFTYQELSAATRKFRPSEMLGSGGFGAVYRGTLPDGQQVAVKSLYDRIFHEGDTVIVPELMTVGRLRHENLVALRGWCLEEGKLLLVYDFMSNGSLENHLYGKNILEWKKRYRIANGLGAALRYLHHECGDVQVVHRDVKPSNVLLDGEFNARLGDFGLAKLVEEHQEERAGVSSSGIAGTVGYLAPEYVMTGEAATHSDVYSFGMVILELACGRRIHERSRPVEERSLIRWLWKLQRSKALIKAADPRLRGAYEEWEMLCLLTMGLSCTHPDPKRRPTMVLVLRVFSKLMPLPSLPKMPKMFR